jgi:DNA invertase Pin-like site-specific DNA recombinase
MKIKQIVAYYRCSTKDQHYGIQVQKIQMNEFLKSTCSEFEIVAEFEEYQSGKNDNRIELAKAIKYCKDNGAILGFTKLDRLSRRASFLHDIKSSGIELKCLDMPELNTLTFGIFATIAEYERELISTRTKSALAVIRQTKTLGNPLGWSKNRQKALDTKIENRKAWLNSNEIVKAKQIIHLLSSHGKPSLNEIARNLNVQGIRTLRGSKWQPNQIKQLLTEI